MDAAPEAAEPPETAEPKAEPRKRSWWRVRIPTSVVVTFVGIALTAWLLPAFTRQWDDRQKAHELKADLQAQIASATARALTGGESLISDVRTPRMAKPVAPVPTAVSKWSIDSLEIDSRLRSYFPANLRHAWEIYTVVMSRTVETAAGQEVAFGSGPQPLSASEDPLPEDLLSAFEQAYSEFTRFFVHRRTFSREAIFAEYRGEVEPALVEAEQQFEAEVLSAHLTGYSTTPRDLIHDLLPF
jgi:hypothetical protein